MAQSDTLSYATSVGRLLHAAAASTRTLFTTAKTCSLIGRRAILENRSKLAVQNDIEDYAE